MVAFFLKPHKARPWIMDAATGTAVLAQGYDPRTVLRSHPQAVAALHRSHVEAGAEIVTTATFQVLEEALCHRAVELARAAQPHAVLGSIGPVNRVDLAPMVAGLENSDGLLLETYSSPEALRLTQYIFHRLLIDPDKPILLSLAYHRVQGKLVSLSGHEPETFARYAEQHGVAALGVNCGRNLNLADITEILHRYRQACDLPLFARPNAGSPGREQLTPEQFAAADWADAVMIGGCCGTTAEHIAALRARWA
ncbi:MAG: homocysteine S-methyltransferase family protein [Gemmataceae bacterium]